jgi:hypothetical protein
MKEQRMTRGQKITAVLSVGALAVSVSTTVLGWSRADVRSLSSAEHDKIMETIVSEAKSREQKDLALDDQDDAIKKSNADIMSVMMDLVKLTSDLNAKVNILLKQYQVGVLDGR